MGRPRIHPVQEFNGIRYYRKPSGYYKADHSIGGEYMHRAVWHHHNGEIPDGVVIHHLDHDRAHNDIDNLDAMDAGAHASMHGSERAAADPEGARLHMASIRPKASEWHRSEEGRAWHVEHGARVAAAQPIDQHACVRCGREYEVKRGGRKVGYCSAACQSAARRESGVDDEQRKCVVCTRSFVTNRYSKGQTCGQLCGGRLATQRRMHGVRPDG